MKHTGRPGPDPSDGKHVRILNRNLTWGENCIEHEADQRHAELRIVGLGLENVTSVPRKKETS